jgi:carbon storage regulator
MLILSRKTNESIIIDGRIMVKIVRLEGDLVKLGIEAPADVPVHRQEVYEEIQKNNREAVTQGRVPLPRLPAKARKGTSVIRPPTLEANLSEPLSKSQ